MHIGRISCANCYGTGKTTEWKVVETDEEAGVGRAQSEEVICTSCNGVGYTEYPVFSVEEAKAILKYCGLSTES